MAATKAVLSADAAEFVPDDFSVPDGAKPSLNPSAEEFHPGEGAASASMAAKSLTVEEMLAIRGSILCHTLQDAVIARLKDAHGFESVFIKVSAAALSVFARVATRQTGPRCPRCEFSRAPATRVFGCRGTASSRAPALRPKSRARSRRTESKALTRRLEEGVASVKRLLSKGLLSGSFADRPS
jgi:hypothetical protein